jgi:Anti-sigma factor NepR
MPRHAAINRRPLGPEITPRQVECDIRVFLAGRTNGETLLRALYDHVLDEPVPQRLRALLPD